MSTVPAATMPPAFATTRLALHALAEHVVCVARHNAVGRIGLVPTTTGFATPPFGDAMTVVGVDGTELFRRDERGDEGGGDQHAPITTLRAAAAFLGVTPGVPGELWKPHTHFELDEPLAVDVDAAGAVARFFAFVGRAIEGLRTAVADRTELAEMTLWPEGFDLATYGGEVNYGGSPGEHVDAADPADEPYLYVGPFGRPLPAAGDAFWNAPFGASVPYRDLADDGKAVEFFVRGHALADRSR